MTQCYVIVIFLVLSISVTTATRTPITEPSSAVAYGSGVHVFSCVFPNPFGTTLSYEIVWCHNGKPMIANGDVYDSTGKQTIDGTINNDGTVSNEITTTLTINDITVDAGGAYLCIIKWGTIYIKSAAATLTVNAISSPPETTNVAAGGEAKFTCVTSGGSVATISFHKTSDDSSVDTVTQTDSVTNGVVETTGVLTIASVTAAAHATDYYCQAKWGETPLKSGNVYLAVLDITGITATVWGVVGVQAKFECKSNGILLANAIGDPYEVPVSETSKMKKKVFAGADISWEYYDTDTWKDTSAISRYAGISSQTDPNGYRIAGLRVQKLIADDDGLKVRCKTTYKSDAENNFFGGTITSGEMTLQLASLTSMTVSKAGPLAGETITFTCVAIGESAPTFSFKFKGNGYTWVDNPSLQSTGTAHTATYKATADEANVLGGGIKVECKANYGQGKGQLKEDVAVTTYYDCSKVTLKYFNTVPGTTAVAADTSDGTLTQTLKCPANTDSVRYSIIESASSATVITCTKDTGMYDKPYLASCVAQFSLKTGTGQQTFALSSTATQSLKLCTDDAVSEWTKVIMIQKLRSETDEVCGFRHVVPCLYNNECSLTTVECRFDSSSHTIYMNYTVTLTTAVWSISERNLKTAINGGVKFWGCSETYTDIDKRKKRDAEGNEFESRSLYKRNATLPNGSTSKSAEPGNAIGATIAGVCAVVLVAALASLFIIRRTRNSFVQIDSEST